MRMKTLPADFPFLTAMYAAAYYPRPLVDRVRDSLREVAAFLQPGGRSGEEIQTELDRVTVIINELQSEFTAAGSAIETVARDDIAWTVERILEFFDIDIDLEDALRNRDW
jgi:hypothetical protein